MTVLADARTSSTGASGLEANLLESGRRSGQPSEVIADCSAFLYHEADLLDRGLFDDWLELYTDDAWYWMPIEPDQDERDAEISLCNDDKAMLALRIERSKQKTAYTEQPPRRYTRHVNNIVVEGRTNGRLSVRSKLLVHAYRVREAGRDEEVFYSATVRHCLLETPQGYKILSKRVDLVNSQASIRLMPDPL